MLDALRARLVEIERQEREAFATYNQIAGARAEVARIIAAIEAAPVDEDTSADH
jgi:hypothetical protein